MLRRFSSTISYLILKGGCLAAFVGVVAAVVFHECRFKLIAGSRVRQDSARHVAANVRDDDATDARVRRGVKEQGHLIHRECPGFDEELHEEGLARTEGCAFTTAFSHQRINGEVCMSLSV